MRPISSKGDRMETATLIGIAKNAIDAGFAGTDIDLTPYESDPKLWEQKATFVTLTIGGQLRGCIGSLQAQRPLAQDIAKNAQNAAFNDPRFNPLSREEFAKTEIEISVLTAPEKLDYTDVEDLRAKIEPFTHGVILQKGIRQSTFLPSVWEQLPDFDGFFANLCMKAGMQSDCLSGHPEIYTYKAHKYKQ
jgi:AmmeMemoRadiSam system protein A